MYLFFDTETSGLPKRWDAPTSDLNNWPRIVQIAWICCDENGNQTSEQVRLIKPVGFSIDPGAAKVHGISTQYATEHGQPIKPILEEFAADINNATVIVAHNIDFDRNIAGAEFLRASMPNVLDAKKSICTMKTSTDFCALPGPYGYKWPKMDELHRKLFNKSFDGAHDAGADCAACMRCFFKLKELGYV